MMDSKVAIEKQLLLDRNLINDSFFPIVSYNHAAMGGHLVEHKTKLCLPTVIARHLMPPGGDKLESCVQSPQYLPVPVTL